MDKEVLIQYCEIMEEIKDLRRRIKSLDKFLEHPPIVADTVKGSKQYGIVGSIKVTGIPNPEYYKKINARERYKKMLESKEKELLKLTCQAEEYIESIEKAELRMMFRFFIIDGMTYIKVAQCMNMTFPRRRIKYTDENVKKEYKDFLKMSPNVPNKSSSIVSCGKQMDIGSQLTSRLSGVKSWQPISLFSIYPVTFQA